MPFYERGDVRLRYEEAGGGFPLLLVPGGGLNSRVSNWPTAVCNSMELFKDEFRCITMDQRNANGGESTGPIPASDPWEAFADDHLWLMDHLGIERFLFMGYCIGGCFALKLMERAPQHVVAGVLVQTVGHNPEHPDYMFNSGRDVWAPELLARRPELSLEQVERYLHDLYRSRPEFVYSVSPDFARSCQTPILVLPDDTPAHPLQASIDVASFCPQAEITVFPWREPPELKGENDQPGPSLPSGAPVCRLTAGSPAQQAVEQREIAPGGGSRPALGRRRPKQAPSSHARSAPRHLAARTGTWPSGFRDNTSGECMRYESVPLLCRVPKTRSQTCCRS